MAEHSGIIRSYLGGGAGACDCVSAQPGGAGRGKAYALRYGWCGGGLRSGGRGGDMEAGEYAGRQLRVDEMSLVDVLYAMIPI